MKHRICDRCGVETDSPLRTLCKKCWYELQEELGYQRLPYITNADRIRSMTDEELADELLEWYAVFSAVEWTKDMILDWLRKEAADKDGAE